MASLFKSRRTWVVTIAAGLAIVLLWYLVIHPSLGGAGRSRFGRRTKALLASATRVEVFRLDADQGPVNHKPKVPGEVRVGGWVVTSQGPDKGEEFTTKLVEVLFDEEAFGENHTKCFDPGVAFRVHSDRGIAEVLICFKCRNLYCGPPTERAKENAGFGAGAWPRLVRLAKEAFPSDKEIQALKEE